MMQHDIRNEIGKFKSPTLVLCSYFLNDDPQQNEKRGHETFQKQYFNLRNAQIVVNTNARHFLMYDEPAWFFSQIDQFLKKS